MKSTLKYVLCITALFSAAFLIIFALPKEDSPSGNAVLRAGAGDDISGYLMEETLKLCDHAAAENEAAVEAFEFNDC